MQTYVKFDQNISMWFRVIHVSITLQRTDTARTVKIFKRFHWRKVFLMFCMKVTVSLRPRGGSATQLPSLLLFTFTCRNCFAKQKCFQLAIILFDLIRALFYALLSYI